jgi:flagellar motor switch protein FliM
MNFTDIRAKVEMITGNDIIENATLTSKTASQLQTGDNIVYNDTETREIHLHINGKNKTRSSLKMVGHRCIGSCLAAI